MLINAQLDRDSYGSILDNTIGIVFFATPHHGADLARLLAPILTFCFSGRRYVSDLRPNSNAIVDMLKGFKKRAEQLGSVRLQSSLQTAVSPNGRLLHPNGHLPKWVFFIAEHILSVRLILRPFLRFDLTPFSPP